MKSYCRRITTRITTMKLSTKFSKQLISLAISNLLIITPLVGAFAQTSSYTGANTQPLSDTEARMKAMVVNPYLTGRDESEYLSSVETAINSKGIESLTTETPKPNPQEVHIIFSEEEVSQILSMSFSDWVNLAMEKSKLLGRMLQMSVSARKGELSLGLESPVSPDSALGQTIIQNDIEETYELASAKSLYGKYGSAALDFLLLSYYGSIASLDNARELKLLDENHYRQFENELLEGYDRMFASVRRNGDNGLTRPDRLVPPVVREIDTLLKHKAEAILLLEQDIVCPQPSSIEIEMARFGTPLDTSCRDSKLQGIIDKARRFEYLSESEKQTLYASLDYSQFSTGMSEHLESQVFPPAIVGGYLDGEISGVDATLRMSIFVMPGFSGAGEALLASRLGEAVLAIKVGRAAVIATPAVLGGVGVVISGHKIHENYKKTGKLITLENGILGLVGVASLTGGIMGSFKIKSALSKPSSLIKTPFPTDRSTPLDSCAVFRPEEVSKAGISRYNLIPVTGKVQITASEFTSSYSSLLRGNNYGVVLDELGNVKMIVNTATGKAFELTGTVSVQHLARLLEGVGLGTEHRLIEKMIFNEVEFRDLSNISLW
jgi:hypothetical protein